MYENKYTLDNVAEFIIGVTPWCMEDGFSSFLQTNNNAHTNVKWAIHSTSGADTQKDMVLSDIWMMLSNNIPVVFSYYDGGNEGITLYPNIQDAITGTEAKSINSHYMTITGLYKCTDNSSLGYKYVLKVVSWGKIYYIDYNEYANKLSYLSNILSVY